MSRELDNDLLTLWCNALMLDEAQVRDLIEQVQEGRDDLAAAEDRAADDWEAERKAATAALEQAETARDEAIAERDAAVRDLEALRDEARAAMERLRDALGEPAPAPVPAGNVTPLRRPRRP